LVGMKGSSRLDIQWNQMMHSITWEEGQKSPQQTAPSIMSKPGLCQIPVWMPAACLHWNTSWQRAHGTHR
jgi:hypothetical protein